MLVAESANSIILQLLCTMATRFPRRDRAPVHRYGFDVDLDISDDNDIDENEIESSNDESDSESNNSDTDDDTISGDGWRFVQCGSDVLPQRPIRDQINEGWQAVTDLNTAEQYIDEFLPPELFESLAKWTNSRALQDEAQHFLDGDDSFTWKEVDTECMRKFIALTLLMGLIKKSTVKSYWSTEPMLDTPYFRACMSRERYTSILRYIRFSDPYSVVNSEKLTRLQDFLRLMKQICDKYKPDELLCIDESLILFKGRIHFKMFIRTKRSRFGIKIFLLTDSNGYLVDVIVYFGSQTSIPCTEQNVDALSKSELIVVSLLSRSNLLDKGYIITVDNWYCSVRLTEFLLTRNTFLRGTCRMNRGIPEELVKKKLTPISSAFMRKGQILAMKFMDKKEVYLLSSVDCAETIEKQRKLSGGNVKQYEKPTAIEQYNTHMGGIDKTDQLISYYSCMRKTHAWFKKLGFNFVQRLLINAFILYCREKEKVSFFDFTKMAIVHLSGVASQPRRSGHFQRAGVQPLPMSANHFPELIQARGNRANPQLRCKKCALNNIRKDTRYQCSGCTTALCIECFKEWHQT